MRRTSANRDFRTVYSVLASGLLVLSGVLSARAAWAEALPISTPTPTVTSSPTVTFTPTFVPRMCMLGSGSSMTLSSRLVVMSLPLQGYQTWQFSFLKPDRTRDMVVPASGSHFDCGNTIFSGLSVRLCARLDPGARAPGIVDCSGGSEIMGYNTITQIDHNTNMSTVQGTENVGLPMACVGGSHDGATCWNPNGCPGGSCQPQMGAADPSCTATFITSDGTVLSSCLEGTDPECSGAAHTHDGVCNSPLVQISSDALPAGGVLLREPIDLALTFGTDCSALTCHCGIGTCSGGATPGAECGADSECGGGTCSTANGSACTTSASCTGSVAPGVCAICPPDDCPLQAGEMQFFGDLTSGQSKSVLWNVNNGKLIMGTIGDGNGANICGTAAGGPECPTTVIGHALPNCVAAVPTLAQLTGAAVVLSYPVIDDNQTVGDSVMTLRLQCGEPTNTPSPTLTPTDTPTPTWTPTPTLTPALACAAAPRSGCQQPQRASAISLNAAAHRLRWKWLGGTTPVALSQFGDPVNGASAYHLCLYDTSGGPPSLAFSATVPAGGMCGTRACWKQIRNRFAYRNAAATPDGVRQMALRATGKTGASIVVSGRGPNLHTPVSADGIFLLREFPQVIVQLQRSDSPGCWESVFSSPPVRDTASAFADRIQ